MITFYLKMMMSLSRFLNMKSYIISTIQDQKLQSMQIYMYMESAFFYFLKININLIKHYTIILKQYFKSGYICCFSKACEHFGFLTLILYYHLGYRRSFYTEDYYVLRLSLVYV